MSANLAGGMRNDALVALCGLSRAQFFRAFRESTGLTAHGYLTQLRLDRAKVLLETTRLPVGEVAAAVGLGAGARFARLFAQRFGAPPGRYRRACLPPLTT